MNKDLVTIENFLPEIGKNEVQKEILSGLTSREKRISSKYFYDKKGSELFEQISKLEEYYPTRTEIAILKSNASLLTHAFRGKTIIELGSGNGTKISHLFDVISEDDLHTITYVPVDVSISAVNASITSLSKQFPGLKLNGIVADFFYQLNLIPKSSNKIICFFGSTIGNLSNQETRQFLKDIHDQMLPGDQFLLGLDMVKKKSELEKAYNDSKQVTAAFNKNILCVVNKLVDTDFNPDDFEHIAFFNESESRIEMHLKAKTDLVIQSHLLDNKIILVSGETIHTENSYKFTPDQITDLADSARLTISNIYTDPDNLFSFVQLKK